jgi:hypothetical protein
MEENVAAASRIIGSFHNTAGRRNKNLGITDCLSSK